MGCCGGGDLSGIKAWFKSLGIFGYLLVALLIVVAGYFIIVHQAHLAAYSTIIFIIVFVGLHLVMMVGHGSHDKGGGGGCGGSHGEVKTPGAGETDTGTNTEEEKIKEKTKGGCH
jgi:hypothetical protein